MFQVGDKYTFNGSSTFYGYFGNYTGTFYAFLPKSVSPSVSSASASISAFGWLMRPQQALSTSNFTISSCGLAGGNTVYVNFTTEVHTTTYYQPCLLNMSNLTITFS